MTENTKPTPGSQPEKTLRELVLLPDLNHSTNTPGMIAAGV